jgi:WD40 repeat protein
MTKSLQDRAVLLFVTIIIMIVIDTPIVLAQQTYTLTISPEPSDARVRIMNIGPRYSDDMALEPGRYDIEVSKEGYFAYREWITLSNDTTLSIPLEAITEEAIQARELKAVTENKPLFTLRNNSRDINRVKVSQSGRYVLAAGYCVIRVWDIRSGSNIKSLFGHNGTVADVAFSPDERYIASAGFDETLRLWDFESSELISILGTSEGYLESVAFSPDGNYLASAGMNNRITLWDVQSQTQIRQFEGHTDWVLSICFSRDGKYLVSGSDDQSVKLWDVATGALLKSFYGFSGSAASVGELIDISPDGKSIIGASTDGAFIQWDIATGEEIRRFVGHAEMVTSIAFSPDGSYIASSGFDKFVKIWSLEGQEIASFPGHEEGDACSWVSSVAISPDSSYVISGGCDDTLRVWVVEAG